VPLKVTDFGTDQKPICNFLLVNNTLTISKLSVLVKLSLLAEGAYLTPSVGVNLCILGCKIQPQKLETSTYHVAHKILLYTELFRHDHQHNRWTDKTADKWTDRITIVITRRLMMHAKMPQMLSNYYNIVKQTIKC